jgi:hypothetical protein
MTSRRAGDQPQATAGRRLWAPADHTQAIGIALRARQGPRAAAEYGARPYGHSSQERSRAAPPWLAPRCRAVAVLRPDRTDTASHAQRAPQLLLGSLILARLRLAAAIRPASAGDAIGCTCAGREAFISRSLGRARRRRSRPGARQGRLGERDPSAEPRDHPRADPVRERPGIARPRDELERREITSNRYSSRSPCTCSSCPSAPSSRRTSRTPQRPPTR